MAQNTGPYSKHLGAYARWQVRRAARGRVPKGFEGSPEPLSMGSFARGRQILAGNIQFTGHVVELRGDGLWDVTPPSLEFAENLHGFGWLDDLAAVGTVPARIKAQDWVAGWTAAFSTGNGPGWGPDIAARRLTRWIHNGFFLLAQTDKTFGDDFFRSLRQHTVYLSRNWAKANPGLPRFEALAGAIYASLTVEGLRDFTSKMVPSLVKECQREIDTDGGIKSRNPEELLEVFTVLNWVVIALRETGQGVPADLTRSIARIAPTLRVLRHNNGHLTRFHGGGRGAEGRLDTALAQSGIRAMAPKDSGMGYLRVTAGSTTLIMDAAAPATGPYSRAAHASTCGIEVTSGKLPLIVGCGSGAAFGENWRLTGRATPSHSTLGLDGTSSARFAPGAKGAESLFLDTPKAVKAKRHAAIDGTRITVSQDGYVPTHGLLHTRVVDVTLNGNGIAGVDKLAVDGEVAQIEFERWVAAGPIPASVRFHIHPDVRSSLDMNGSAVSLTLKSGDVWVFRHDGAAQLSLEPSVYLEQGRVAPRTADQIVLSLPVSTPDTRVQWTLAKAKVAKATPEQKDTR